MNDFVIWSWTHCAWWRPGRLGYTKDLTEAGSYSKEEAGRIVTTHRIPFRHLVVMLWSEAEVLGGGAPPIQGIADDLIRGAQDWVRSFDEEAERAEEGVGRRLGYGIGVPREVDILRRVAALAPEAS